MRVIFLHVYLCTTSSAHREQKVLDALPGTAVTDVCELPYQCWGPDLGPLEEQPMLLTTETSLQPLKYFLL